MKKWTIIFACVLIVSLSLALVACDNTSTPSTNGTDSNPSTNGNGNNDIDTDKESTAVVTNPKEILSSAIAATLAKGDWNAEYGVKSVYTFGGDGDSTEENYNCTFLGSGKDACVKIKSFYMEDGSEVANVSMFGKFNDGKYYSYNAFEVDGIANDDDLNFHQASSHVIDSVLDDGWFFYLPLTDEFGDFFSFIFEYLEDGEDDKLTFKGESTTKKGATNYEITVTYDSLSDRGYADKATITFKIENRVIVSVSGQASSKNDKERYDSTCNVTGTFNYSNMAPFALPDVSKSKQYDLESIEDTFFKAMELDVDSAADLEDTEAIAQGVVGYVFSAEKWDENYDYFNGIFFTSEDAANTYYQTHKADLDETLQSDKEEFEIEEKLEWEIVGKWIIAGTANAIRYFDS
jgi:hypothetical protein